MIFSPLHYKVLMVVSVLYCFYWLFCHHKGITHQKEINIKYRNFIKDEGRGKVGSDIVGVELWKLHY